MANSNFSTWQKVAVIFIVIFGVIIAFSYFQSSHLDDQSTAYIPALEEQVTSSTAPTIEVAIPTAAPAATQITEVPEKRIQDVDIPSTPSTQSKAVAASKTSTPKETTTQKTTTKGAYKIQIASFKEGDKAQKLLSKLKESGFEAMVIERNLGEKGVWHQVQVGPFDNKSDAETKLAELKPNYKESFIKRQ